jgi:hypothetical protein
MTASNVMNSRRFIRSPRRQERVAATALGSSAFQAGGALLKCNGMKKVAILQSNYIPWKGYFDMIAAVDEFILFDDAQYTRLDWRNRNKIKTPYGLKWLSVPIVRNFGQSIREARIDGTQWIEAHWNIFSDNYRKAPFYRENRDLFEPIYQRGHTHLSLLNRDLIEAVCTYLGIATKISDTADYRLIDGRTARLVDICMQAGATEYVSGPAAKYYIDESLFAESGIALTWFSYGGYPQYPQLHGDFQHGVTILDLLFNTGPEAPAFMRCVRKENTSA